MYVLDYLIYHLRPYGIGQLSDRYNSASTSGFRINGDTVARSN